MCQLCTVPVQMEFQLPCAGTVAGLQKPVHADCMSPTAILHGVRPSK